MNINLLIINSESNVFNNLNDEFFIGNESEKVYKFSLVDKYANLYKSIFNLSSNKESNQEIIFIITVGFFELLKREDYKLVRDGNTIALNIVDELNDINSINKFLNDNKTLISDYVIIDNIDTNEIIEAIRTLKNFN